MTQTQSTHTQSTHSQSTTIRPSALTLMAIVLMFALMSGPAWAQCSMSELSGFQDLGSLTALVNAYETGETKIVEFATTWDGEWVIVPKTGPIEYSSGFPADVRLRIQIAEMVNYSIEAVAITPYGEYAVIAGPYIHVSDGVPNRSLLEQKIVDLRASSGTTIGELTFNADGTGWILTSGSEAHIAPSAGYFPDDLVAAVLDSETSRRHVSSVALGTDGKWAVATDRWFASETYSCMFDEMQRLLQEGKAIGYALIGPNGSYIVGSHGAYAWQNDIEAMEALVGGYPGIGIYQRMKDLDIPGVSIAIIRDNKVELARGYGTLNKDNKQTWVRTDTPFGLASLSKYLTALACMKLVDQGKLSLNSNALSLGLFPNALPYRYLDDWFSVGPARPGMTITRLLSHTASIATAPTNSRKPMNDSFWNSFDTWTFLSGQGLTTGVHWDQNLGEPGTSFDYANRGYVLAQAIVEHKTGVPFTTHMQDLVLGPLGMDDSTAMLPLDNAWDDRTAQQHHRDNGYATAQAYRRLSTAHAGGGYHGSAADYAKAMIVLMRAGQTETGATFMSFQRASDMLTDRVGPNVVNEGGDPANTNYGFGLYLKSNGFAHNGYSSSGIKAKMRAYTDKDVGIVILVNTNSSGIANEIQDAFELVYN